MAGADSSKNPSEDLFAPSPGPRWAAAFLVLIAVGVGVAWLAGFLDAYINYFSPQLVEATGKVIYNGEPLPFGFVGTKCEISGCMGGMGAIESDGKFQLETEMKPGIFAGPHRVFVQCAAPGFPPVPLIPAEYSDPQTSPLRLIAKRGRKNYIEFQLKGPPLKLKSDKKPVTETTEVGEPTSPPPAGEIRR